MKPEPLPEGSKMSIHCQNCGAEWEEDDTRTSFYFESSTFEIGDYASPSDISGAAESPSFCPKCPDRRLRRITEDMNELKRSKSFAADRLPEEDGETASGGDADVVHS